MTETASDQRDIIDVLLVQHQLVKQTFAKVQAASGEEQRQRFAELADLLHLHETGEQQVVHPLTRSADQQGQQVAGARLAEEAEAEEKVAELRDLAVDDSTFAEKLDALERAVLAHATLEEEEEFPILGEIPEEQRQAMAQDLQRVQTAI